MPKLRERTKPRSALSEAKGKAPGSLRKAKARSAVIAPAPEPGRLGTPESTVAVAAGGEGVRGRDIQTSAFIGAFEAHITCERISVEAISTIAAHMQDAHGFRTGDLLLHLNSFDLDSGSVIKSFFSALGPRRAGLENRMRKAVALLRSYSVKVKRAKIERIILDERYE